MLRLFPDSDDEEETFTWMEGDSLAPPCQSESAIVDKIIDFAGLTAADVLYDLGCGDGRICIAASEKYGIQSCGVEIESILIEKFEKAVGEKALKGLVRIEHGDLREIDLSRATVVVVYLLREGIEEIKEKLMECLRRGCRVICNTFGIRGLNYADVMDCGTSTRLFLYDARCLGSLDPLTSGRSADA